MKDQKSIHGHSIKQVIKMTESNQTPKKLPGIPDRTLAFIVQSAGGTIEKFLSEEGRAHVRLTIGKHCLESDTNTRLLIQVMELINNG